MSMALDAYLDLTADDAVVQWRRVLARRPRARQEPYLPVETLLCFGLFYMVDPHGYGGSNIHEAPAVVHTLAALFQRTPGSITSKMLNMDGSRSNCAQWEPALFQLLSTTPGLYRQLYLLVLGVARGLGLGPDNLPDFLKVGEASELELLGQDELGSTEISQALEHARERIGRNAQAFGLTEQETSRIEEQRVRLGQHRFARAVLGNYDHRCAFCGFQPRRLPGHRLLVASHIKPWRESSNRERLDPRNGIAACPVHDSAFDTGLLMVNGGLKIHRAQPLLRSLVADEGVERYFGGHVLEERLLVPKGGEPPDPRYLHWHREHFQAKHLAR